MYKIKILLTLAVLFSGLAFSQEYHVAKTGDDDNPGSASKPFKTISKAAEVAMPGSVITVHAGVYRERINPPRGGTSDDNRIVYRAAEGEEVIIKGSEVIDNWKRFKGSVWKAVIPNAFFGDYNPYNEKVRGDWFRDYGRVHHTGEVYLNGISLFEVPRIEQVLNPKPLEKTQLKKQSTYTWYCESDKNNTYLYANFHQKNPNKEQVEINVRKACFYPDKTDVNYITVRGFTMRQAATQWAPPTAEQVGLIGTNWSKGWIIEDNVISDSKCTGITLGKDRASGHNLATKDSTVAGVTHYNRLITKVLKEPFNWSKENIGSHIVRNNTIYNCEQAGICGSMGCAFSTIANNHIYDIWTKRQFGGAEISGIKFHGPVDAVIKNNRIHNARKGMWLDWMTQGTRVSGNLLYNNYSEDIFVEVNHGPFLIDNNLLLSNSVAILDGSSGGAYINNLVKGKIIIVQQSRSTPWLKPHSTQVYGRTISDNADNRFYNNIFTTVEKKVNDTMPNNWWMNRGTYGLGIYDGYCPMYVNGNVYLKGAKKYPGEKNAVVLPDHDPEIKLEERGDKVFLHLRLPQSIKDMQNEVINTGMLGRVNTSDMRFVAPDGSSLLFNTDYWGESRNKENTWPGPFENPGTGKVVIRVW